MQNIPDKIYSLSPVEVLNGYANGFFPMGDSKNSVDWYEADPRAIVNIKNERTHGVRSLIANRWQLTAYVYAICSTRCFFVWRLFTLVESMVFCRFWAERMINFKNL